MAFIIADRVKEVTTSTGIGPLALGGPGVGYQAFSAVCTVGDVVPYVIEDSVNGAWEVGIGTYSAPNTLARTTVLSSSNSNTAVSFGTGTKAVWIDLPASRTGLAWRTQTANYTALSGDMIHADTSAGAFTVTLPASPLPGDRVVISDPLQTWDVYALTLAPNGNKIGGQTDALVISDPARVELTYRDAVVGWVADLYGLLPAFTRWNPYDAALGAFVLLPNGRTVVGVSVGTGNWRSMRANRARSAGKRYFEQKIDLLADTYAPMIGVGSAAAAVGNYVGFDANGWGITASGHSYTGAVAIARTPYATGDVVGVAVDFTPGTGSVAFFKNNVANGSYTGLTLPALYPMVSMNGLIGSAKGTLRTRAHQCSYAPPSGYSYWDT